MTRRYNLSHLAGQPMPEDWIHLPDSVVAAADYDALAARLAEAMRLLDEIAEDFDDLATYPAGSCEFTRKWEIRAFLAADSGDERECS